MPLFFLLPLFYLEVFFFYLLVFRLTLPQYHFPSHLYSFFHRRRFVLLFFLFLLSLVTLICFTFYSFSRSSTSLRSLSPLRPPLRASFYVLLQRCLICVSSFPAFCTLPFPPAPRPLPAPSVQHPRTSFPFMFSLRPSLLPSLPFSMRLHRFLSCSLCLFIPFSVPRLFDDRPAHPHSFPVAMLPFPPWPSPAAPFVLLVSTPFSVLFLFPSFLFTASLTFLLYRLSCT